eukprot:3865102-Ditylum_brightwellii.AAC.1
MGYCTSQPKQYASVEGKANDTNNKEQDDQNFPLFQQTIDQTEEEKTYSYKGGEGIGYTQEILNIIEPICSFADDNAYDLDDWIEIGKYAFYYCSELRSIIIPEGVEEVGKEAFVSCSRLSKVDLPSSFKQIKSGAFNGCGELTSSFIPEGVEVVDNDVFGGCEKLVDVKLPTTSKN